MVNLTKKNGYKLKSCKNKLKLSKLRGGGEGNVYSYIPKLKSKSKISVYHKFLGNLGIKTPTYKKYQEKQANLQRAEMVSKMQNYQDYQHSAEYRLNGKSRNEAQRLYLINKLQVNTPIYNQEKVKNLKAKYNKNVEDEQYIDTIQKLPEKNKNYIKEISSHWEQIRKKEDVNSKLDIQPILNSLSEKHKEYLKESGLNDSKLEIYNKETEEIKKKEIKKIQTSPNTTNKITKVDEINYILNDIGDIYHRLTKSKFKKQIATKAKANFFKDREDLNLINKLSLDELKELRDKYNEYKKDIKDGKDGNKFQLYKIQLVAKILNKK
jgi:hypothetical protein